MGRQIVTSWRFATAGLAETRLEERLRARHGKVGTLAHLASRSLPQPSYTVADYRALLGSARRGQQAVIFFFYDRVALAGTLFQSRAVEHPDMSARVTDQSRLLQAKRRLGHPFATHAQHVGDQLLRHHKLV